MIPRYETQVMRKVWSDERRYALWGKVEKAHLEVLADAGEVPKNLPEVLEEALGQVSAEAVRAKERETEHEMTAFLRCLTERAPQLERYLHHGLTSSDVMDTAFSLQIREAVEALRPEAEEVASELRRLGERYWDVLTVGRTHGMWAEPMPLGAKFLRFRWNLLRAWKKLQRAAETLPGKLSGAVGTYTGNSPEVEEKVLRKLGLRPEPAATQVVPRDRYAEALWALCLLGGVIEQIALEIRHLQRSEVDEWREPFRKKQHGSSAMPHKRNPILSERLCGQARLLRGYLTAHLESLALWHERDISHSSVERVAFSDAFHLMHYMLKKLREILKDLEVDTERIQRRLKEALPEIVSSYLLHRLVEKGASRQEAYEWLKELSALGPVLREAQKDARVREFLKEEDFREEKILSFYRLHADTLRRRLGGEPE